MLSKTGTNTGIVRVYDSTTGNLNKNIFFGSLQSPIGITAIADVSGNGVDEVAVLGENGGVTQVVIKDSKNGALVNTIDYP